MIHFAICDDDQAFAGTLDSMLMALSQQYEQEFEISVFFSGEEFCGHINNTNEVFDVVLMDIEMRGITGIEAGRKLRDNIANDLTLLIFVSGHQNYYREIVDLNVFCFISKPVFHNEFRLKLNKAINRVLRQRHLALSPIFSIKKGKSEIHIQISKIMYLESDARQIHLHAESENITYYGVLDEEERKLPKNLFVRIHKSYLINLSHVISITSKEVTLSNKTIFVISDRFRATVKTAYLHYRGND